MPMYLSCVERQARLLDLIPYQSAGEHPHSAQLLARMADAYTGTDSARRRRLERDLKELEESGQIRITNPGRRTRCFQRVSNDSSADPHLLDYIQALSDALLKERLPNRRYEQVWAKLRDTQRKPLLAER